MRTPSNAAPSAALTAARDAPPSTSQPRADNANPHAPDRFTFLTHASRWRVIADVHTARRKTYGPLLRRFCGHLGRCPEVAARREMRPRDPQQLRDPFGQRNHYDHIGSRVHAQTRMQWGDAEGSAWHLTETRDAGGASSSLRRRLQLRTMGGDWPARHHVRGIGRPKVTGVARLDAAAKG